MKPDAIVIGAVLAILAAGIALVSWLQRSAPFDGVVVRKLAATRAPVPPEVFAAAPAPPASAVVFFEFDQAVLRESEAAKLDRFLAARGAAGLRFEAIGYADRIGSREYNLRLSQRRADAVKAYFVEKRAIDPAAIQTHALGEREPQSGDACIELGAELRKNRTLVECLQPDRRVAITVRGAT